MAASVSGPCHAVAQFDDSRIYGQDLRQEPGRYRGQLGRGLLRNLLTSLLLPTLDPHGNIHRKRNQASIKEETNGVSRV